MSSYRALSLDIQLVYACVCVCTCLCLCLYVGRHRVTCDVCVPCREAEAWAKAKQITRPADVWLWVQGVDALCLRYLLDDPEVPETLVIDSYREQFAFGSSQRVKVSAHA